MAQEKQLGVTLPSIHGSGAVSSFRAPVRQHGRGSREDATELTRHANQLHEIQLELQRLATTTSQAEERAKVAEEKACAAVTVIGMVKAPEQKKTKLNNRDAEKFWPETYTADCVDKKELRRVLGRGRDVPEGAGTRPVGETSAGVGWRFPRPADRVE